MPKPICFFLFVDAPLSKVISDVLIDVTICNDLTIYETLLACPRNS
jgi:hypothetical protein